VIQTEDLPTLALPAAAPGARSFGSALVTTTIRRIGGDIEYD
jgi:hypothetical protein